MQEISKTVDSALGLLELLRESGQLTIAELSHATQQSRTAVVRQLVALERHGFVSRAGGRCVLGHAFLSFASGAETALRAVGRPALEHLVEASGETGVLSVRAGFEAVAIEQVVSPRHLVRAHYDPGYRHSLSAGAHGRAILAALDAASARPIIDAHPDPAWLEAELDTIRNEGVAVSRGELESGIVGIAAAACTEHGPIGSIGVIGPVDRFDVGHVRVPLLAAVADMTARLSPNEVAS
ncbi:MAG: IclR family transcriptional regulator [Acidimicrobiales bacterium]